MVLIFRGSGRHCLKVRIRLFVEKSRSGIQEQLLKACCGIGFRLGGFARTKIKVTHVSNPQNQNIEDISVFRKTRT